MKILSIAFLLLGTLSIVYNQAGANTYAQFQKGWGLEGRTALLVGRLLCVLGGLMFAALGLFLNLR